MFSLGNERVHWEQIGYDDDYHYDEINGPKIQLLYHLFNRIGFV